MFSSLAKSHKKILKALSSLSLSSTHIHTHTHTHTHTYILSVFLYVFSWPLKLKSYRRTAGANLCWDRKLAMFSDAKSWYFDLSGILCVPCPWNGKEKPKDIWFDLFLCKSKWNFAEKKRWNKEWRGEWWGKTLRVYSKASFIKFIKLKYRRGFSFRLIWEISMR